MQINKLNIRQKTELKYILSNLYINNKLDNSLIQVLDQLIDETNKHNFI